ncbi:MAG: sterol desaturase family protein [Bacteriovoracaceae bacterium]
MNIDQYRQAFRAKVIPSYYNGKVHVFIFTILQMATTAYWFNKVPEWSLKSIPVILLSILWASWILYFTHRYLLHRKIWGLHWAFKMHHWHHTFYQETKLEYDESNDLYMLFMPPWLQSIYFFLYLPAIYLLLKPVVSEWALTLVISVLVVWYGAYELIHWICHLGKEHIIQRRFAWARWMKEHHRFHHHKIHKDHCNFGIVEPSMDYIFKTKK